MKEKDLKENGLADMAYKVEKDHEVQMARGELYKVAKYSIKMHEMLKGVSEEQGLEGWVQAKITKAADYLGSVYHHMDYEMKFDEVTEAKETCSCDCDCGKAICESCGKPHAKKDLKVKEGNYGKKKNKKNEEATPVDDDDPRYADDENLPKNKKKKKAKKESIEKVGKILYDAEDALLKEDLGAALNHLVAATKEIGKTIGGGAIDAVAGGAGAAMGLPSRIKSKFQKAKSGVERNSINYEDTLADRLQAKLAEANKE
ncbi:MAG: hypothetical protein CMA64_05760 [Euryarchaeota archaeon]|nr:hypothetical protein [Euryarchaeota archaeon]